jgi:hypothetical protein
MLKLFKKRANAYKLVRQRPWGKSWPNWLKALCLLSTKKVSSKLLENNNNDWSGDIVLHIS